MTGMFDETALGAGVKKADSNGPGAPWSSMTLEPIVRTEDLEVWIVLAIGAILVRARLQDEFGGLGEWNKAWDNMTNSRSVALEWAMKKVAEQTQERRVGRMLHHAASFREQRDEAAIEGFMQISRWPRWLCERVLAESEAVKHEPVLPSCPEHVRAMIDRRVEALSLL